MASTEEQQNEWIHAIRAGKMIFFVLLYILLIYGKDIWPIGDLGNYKIQEFPGKNEKTLHYNQIRSGSDHPLWRYGHSSIPRWRPSAILNLIENSAGLLIGLRSDPDRSRLLLHWPGMN